MSNKKLLFIINGNPTAGKDTFIQYFENYLSINYGYSLQVKNLSSVDLVKHVAVMLGWNGEKTPEARNFLSDMKDSWTAYNDGPFNYIKNEVLAGEQNIYFAHLREPSEIEKLHNYFESSNENVMSIPIFIKRDIQVDATNHADNNVANYAYHHYITNNGTLENLQEKANVFAEEMIQQIFSSANQVSRI